MTVPVACAATDVPWSAIIGAAVGVAGIIGGIVTGHLANRAAAQREQLSDQAAARRLQLEYAEADRTRFHDLRVELYGKLFAAVIALRLAIAEARPRFRELTKEVIPAFVDSFNPQFAALVSITQIAQMIALGPARESAKAVLEAVLSLQLHSWEDGATYKRTLNQLDEALSNFSEQARAELLPSGEHPG